MKLTVVFAMLVVLAATVYAQTDAAKDAADKAKLPDAPKLDKDAVTTPDPKDATKKAEDAAGKAKEQAGNIGKKLSDAFKL